MDDLNLPEYLTENADGSITISFADLRSKPVIDGTEVGELTMREPSVGDQLSADKASTHRGEQEVAIFANLTEQAPAAIREFKLRAYGRLQDAYSVFTS